MPTTITDLIGAIPGMTITAITHPDVRRAQAALDGVRETAAASAARITCDLMLICRSTDEVNAIAAEWDVPAGWTADLSQYRTLTCTWPANVAAVYIPPVAGLVAA